MQVPSLGLEDTLEESLAAHSSILAWRILWTEESGRLQSIGSQTMGQTEATKHSPVITTWCFHCGGPGSIPSQDTKIPCKPCSMAGKKKKAESLKMKIFNYYLKSTFNANKEKNINI